VYGPSGAGKKTRVVAVLSALYGPGVEKLKIDQRVFVTPSNRKLEVNIVSSSFHLELTPTYLPYAINFVSPILFTLQSRSYTSAFLVLSSPFNMFSMRPLRRTVLTEGTSGIMIVW
jgi:hypothetical protein